MADPFIDRLYAHLVAEHTGEPGTPRIGEDRAAAAIHGWWAQFADVLGQKIGAWNEKRPSATPVHFTTFGADRVRIGHVAADLEIRLEHNQVVARPPVRNDQSDERVIFQLELTEAGNVAANIEGMSPVTSPAEAAEVIIAPILTRVFAGSR